MTYNHGLGPLSRRLSALAPLGRAHLEIIEATHRTVETCPAGSELCAEGLANPHVWSVITGWMVQTRTLMDGRRQVVGIILPGDTINLTWHPNPLSLHGVECVTDVALARAEGLLNEALSASDGVLWAAFTAAHAQDEATMLNTIACLGRQSAYERLSLFFLDLFHRLSRVGLADANSFYMPLTQQVLADKLALSVVHVNRTLMQLGRDGVVIRSKKKVTIADVHALARQMDYRPLPARSNATCLPPNINAMFSTDEQRKAG